MSDRRVVHEAIWAPLIAAVFLAARFFPFEHLPFFACPFRTITSIPCLACGGTRAVVAFVHFDFATAFAMNPLVASCAVLGSLYLLHALGVLVTRRPWRPVMPKLLRAAAAFALLLNWGYLIAVGR